MGIKLLNHYAKLVNEYYSEPKEEVILGSFLQNILPVETASSKRKATENINKGTASFTKKKLVKVTTPSRDIRSMFKNDNSKFKRKVSDDMVISID